MALESRGTLEAWASDLDTVAKREAVVRQILESAIDLSRPDDLSFLELQVPRIAHDIVDRLYCGEIC